MNKSIIAIFFSLVFAVTFTVPTLVLILDSDFDVSIIVDSYEEEEEKEGNEGKDSLNDTEIKFFQMSDKEGTGFYKKVASKIEGYSNSYISAPKELSPPPPEYFVL